MCIVYIVKYIYIYIHICKYIYVYKYMYIYTYIYTNLHICIQMYIRYTEYPVCMQKTKKDYECKNTLSLRERER